MILSRPEISVVIPNYNGVHLLERNLPIVLAAASAYAKGTEVIVVDDGSSDASVELLSRQFPDVRRVIHEKNRGFAEAVHSGVAAASGELCFLLNSDVQPDIDCLAPLAEYFSDRQVFAVSPVIYSEDGSVDKHSWYVAEFKRGGLKRLDWNLPDAIEARKTRRLPTLYASGGSMLLRKSQFQALGGFHPLFKPFYSEDVDLGIRAWRQGLASYVEPGSKVLHFSHGSIKDAFKLAVVQRTRKRNKYLLEWFHFPLWRLVFQSLPFTLLQALGELLTWDTVNLGGLVDALGRLGDVRRARAALRETDPAALQQVIDTLSAALREARR